MRRREFMALLSGVAVAWPLETWAQQPGRPQRVGIVLEGGPSYRAGVDGLREGLKAAGLEEGPRLALVIRDTEGDLNAVEVAARALEREDGVDLIVAFAGSVALAVKRSTEKVPIVFVAGADSVALGLVDSLARPGGRLTGLHSITLDLTPKRFEFLRELMPGLRRIVTFYDPGNRTAMLSLELARDAAQRLGIALTAEPVRSKEEIRERLRALGTEDAEAFVFTPDAMVNSQSSLILERTGALRMAAASVRVDLVHDGALIGYGFSYRDLGRRAASYVSRILAGTSPGDLPVEAVSVPALAINLKAAKALGIEVPPALLDRADEVIE
jgi:putative tryptophan/tyrosine transport system substrate-binding protein